MGDIDLTAIPTPPKQDPFEFVEVDGNVAASLPADAKIIAATPHGASFWTRSARIDVELSNGSPHAYFMKVATGDVGRGMLQGEFEGAIKLQQVIPEGTPKVVAWGTYASQSDTHFYLCDFVDMIEDLPDFHGFCALLAKLHKESMMQSENGKFGFHVVTYKGTMHQGTDWCDTWEESYIVHLKRTFAQERAVDESRPAYDELLPPLYEKVIPRLLRPLTTHGRSIKPSLIHGDIWSGNLATNASTGLPLMFDAGVFWGHNECMETDDSLHGMLGTLADKHEGDLGTMGIGRYRMGQHWRKEYHKHFPISAPEDDYEDRMILYELYRAPCRQFNGAWLTGNRRSHVCAATLYPDTSIFHNLLFREVRRLVEKYPDGYQGQ